MQVKIFGVLAASSCLAAPAAMAGDIKEKCVAVAATDTTMPAEFDEAFVDEACACIETVVGDDEAVKQEISEALENAAIADRLDALGEDTRSKVDACLAPGQD